MSEGIDIKLERNSRSDHCSANSEANNKEILPTPEKCNVSTAAAVVSLGPDVDLDKFGNIRDDHSGEPIKKRLKLSETSNRVKDSTCSTRSSSSGNDVSVSRSTRTSTNHGANDKSTSNQGQTETAQENELELDLDVIEGEILIKAKTQEELTKLIDQMTKFSAQKLIQVTDININTNLDDNLYLKAKQILQISSLTLPQLYSIHIHSNIHENVTANLLEDLFVKFGETLTHFRLTGGYVGFEKEHFVIRIPQLPKLETFYFHSEYTFEPSYEIDKGVIPGEIIEIDDNSCDEVVSENLPANLEFFRITIYLPKLKKLRELYLGCLVNVITTDPLKSKDEEFYFDYFENLQVFHVGSPWHKVVKYIPKGFKKVENQIKSFQFPDFLTQPAFIEKIAEEFPRLTEIHLNLPSPEVLQKFFQVFRKIPIEELHLRTSFVFEETLERILCGKQKMKMENENEEVVKIAWFRKNGNFDEFQISAREKKTTMTGVGGLKDLTHLQIVHIAQKIHFPRYNRTLGFDEYDPFPQDSDSLIKQLKKLKRIKHFSILKKKHCHPKLKSYLCSIGFTLEHCSSNTYHTKISEENRLKISAKNPDLETNGKHVKKESVKKEKLV